MTRTVSATMAKSNFGALVESVSHGEGQIVVENRGEPVAAIISIAALKDYEELRVQRRRAEALARLKTLRERVSARNADLTEEEAKAFIKQIVDETMKSMVAKGIIRYQD